MSRKYFAFAALVLLMGCTDNGVLLRSSGKSYTSSNSNGIYKIGTPYQINNTWYYPAENYEYQEVGVASWYGPDFHGGITANGEKYNMNAMTAAHRTLPLPCVVKVTNLENGKNVVVRVNDRGPFVNNRIIDLSKQAAHELDFHQNGTTQVRVEVLREESITLKNTILKNGGKVVGGTSSGTTNESLKTTALSDGYYIQAGSFSAAENAQKLVLELRPMGTAKVIPVKVNGSTFYRVRLGPYTSPESAVNDMDTIKKRGYTDARIIQEVN